MRFLPSRHTLVNVLLPLAVGALLFAAVSTVAYQLGAADAAGELRIYRALVNGYAEHDAHDDATIADLTAERDALQEDFTALEAWWEEER